MMNYRLEEITNDDNLNENEIEYAKMILSNLSYK
jgi:hypothetical protein